MGKLFQKLAWNNVREDIKDINPTLTQLIDGISPDNRYPIYKLECPWGQSLLEEGMLFLPNSCGKWVPLDDSSIEPAVAQDLAYNLNMPLGVVLHNSIELYIKALDRIIPFVFMKPGTILGLWISLHQDKSNSNHIGKTSNITAGSRSSLFLPKISDTNSFRKLKKKFRLRCSQPKDFSEQWPLFLELSNHQEFPQKWSTVVIYFSKRWLEIHDDIAWKLFKSYLLEYAWERTAYLRNQMIFDLAFSCALEERNLRPNPYLTDTVKHIFSLCQNIYPAYEVANDNLALPLDAFQKIFNEIYDLKYRPTIMIPGYLDSTNSVYYSLEVPTLMAFSPKSRKLANKLEDLREIKYITQRVVDCISEKRFKQEPISRIMNKFSLYYYHTDIDKYQEISSTYEIEQVDQNLILEAKKIDNTFCSTSPFLRGCIRISNK